MGKRVAVLDTDPQQSLCSWANLGDGLLRQITRAADIVLIDTPPAFADPALLADIVLPGITQRTVVAEAALTGLTVVEFPHINLARGEFRQLADAVLSLID